MINSGQLKQLDVALDAIKAAIDAVEDVEIQEYEYILSTTVDALRKANEELMRVYVQEARANAGERVFKMGAAK